MKIDLAYYDNAIKNIRYCLDEVNKKERSFEDMDITLRLHQTIRFLQDQRKQLYKNLYQKEGGIFG